MASPGEHPKTFEPGVVLDGRYRLDSVLGEGGVGQVFRARHLQLGNDVAIKVLQTQFEGHSAMRPRFLREAQAMAALKHPHIITITDFQTGSGPPYIVMELLEGLTLREATASRPFPLSRARRILENVLDALSYAHDKGFVHRDLKPDNIFLLDLASDDAFPKILDFGFVKLTEDAEPVDAAGVLTRSGIAFGTPAYMSPEQATGAPAEPRSDLYSLGIVFFEMLAGRRPYEGSLPEVVRKHLTAAVPSFSEVGASVRENDALRRFFQQAMAKEPKDRFSSAAAMKRALLALPEDSLRALSSEESSAKIWSVAPTVPAMTVRAKRDGGRGGARNNAPSAATIASSPPRSRARRWGYAALVSVAGLGAWGAMSLDSEGAPEEPNAEIVSAVEPTEAHPSESPILEGGVGERTAEDSAAEDSAAEDSAAEDSAAEDSAAEDSAEEEPESTHTDPWAESAPGWMRRSYARTLAGRTLSTRTEDALKRYARANRDDPRPHLLLGHSYAARGWDSSALERYGLAQRIDSSAAADPHMLSELVRLSVRSTDPPRAASMLVSIYGAEALEAVDAVIAGGVIGDSALDDTELARIRQLRASLL